MSLMFSSKYWICGVGLNDTKIVFVVKTLQIWREKHFDKMIDTKDKINANSLKKAFECFHCQLLLYLAILKKLTITNISNNILE